MGNFDYLKLTGLAVQGINVLVTVLLFLSVQRINKEKANNERFSALEKAVAESIKDLSERTAKLEIRVEQTPTHDDLAKIHEKINEVSDCVSRLEGEFSGATRTLNLIHETLMERGR